MDSPNDYDLELEFLSHASIGRWRGRELIEIKAFCDLRDYLREKSESLKETSTISKQMVDIMLQASEVLAQSEHHDLADEFIQLLSMMAKNQSYAERHSGVPRIF
ncbi:hypothetical protein [Celerinatantimonas sp. MCCC 1A17872]|uniref:hypothetical protein n=1 Tax=Celerinatantimonas sp. MCCC 1A17872 TaxID=3177514 RepID=UPI0038CA36EB